MLLVFIVFGWENISEKEDYNS